jgi:ornithine cyclodeaminase
MSGAVLDLAGARPLVLSGDDVRRLLPMDACIEAMEGAFRALAGDRAVLPLRQVVRLPRRGGLLGVMPSYLEVPVLGAVTGAKIVSVFPENHGTELDAHQGSVLLFEAERGRLLCLADASAVTAIRTAAASGLATRLLARADAGDLAILGSGVQAASHLEAMLAVREIRRVRVWSRTPQRSKAFAETSVRHGVAVEVMNSAQEAVERADLICTVTSSSTPVLLGRWLSEGAHVNAVGSSVPSSREVDGEAVARSRLFVDRRESALAEAGDLLGAIEDGAVGSDHIAGELADVLTGTVAGRRTEGEITMFESLGLAIEDLAAVACAYVRATGEDVR